MELHCAKILLIRRRFRYSVGPGSLSEYFPWPRPRQISPKGVAEPTQLGRYPIRRRLSRQEADLNAANAAAPQGEAQERRVQRRMRGNLPGPEGLAGHFARAQPLYLAVPADLCAGASAALHGLPVVSTTGRAARLASAPPHGSDVVGQAQLHRTDIRPCQRGSREILRQAPRSRRPCRVRSSRRPSDCEWTRSSPIPPRTRARAYPC